MAINESIIIKALDEEFEKVSQIGFMRDKCKNNFISSNKVEATIGDSIGLADYSRNSGFSPIYYVFSNKEFVLKQDRGRKFMLPDSVRDEIEAEKAIEYGLREYFKIHIIPEVESYVFSKLLQNTKEKGNKLSFGDIKNKGLLFDGYEALKEKVRDSGITKKEDVVCYMPYQIYKNFKKFDISFDNDENILVVPVSSRRMYTDYDFYDGGFIEKPDASLGTMLMLPKSSVVLALSNMLKVFPPDYNVNSDAFEFAYRVAYDLFIDKNYEDSIWALL